MKRLFIAALSLMATGCGIYNRYERPDSVQVEADSLYRTENAPDTTSSLASLKWEELFTDPYCSHSSAAVWKQIRTYKLLFCAWKKLKPLSVRPGWPTFLQYSLTRRVRSPATTEAKHKRHILSVVLHRGKSTCSAN